MGAVGSGSGSGNSTNAAEPPNGKFTGGIFGSFGGSGSVGSDVSKSANLNSASASSASAVTYKSLDARLAALEQSGVDFLKVVIYTQPLPTGVGQHHGLIYHYERRFAPMALGGSSYMMTGGNCCLQIDWGQDGITFADIYTEHAGKIVKEKQCGITPATLLEQVHGVQKREYHLLQWNCQHFSRHLFGKCQFGGLS